MKYPSCAFRRPISLLACSLLAIRLAAQTATPVESRSDASVPAEVVELSPFVVNSSRDEGFVAASSLAGGRLAGDLKDTPVAYSVLTREFMDAVGIDDLIGASEWSVNSVNLQGAGQEEIFGNGFEVSSRGVSVGGQQRNFFPLNVNFDSYNLDRYDYSRGPNAVLFGQGSFGGTSNAVTKRAQFSGAAKTSLRFNYGSWDKRRVEIDDNRTLSDKVAVRTNILWQNRQGWRDFEMENKKAITLAATIKLTKRTELLLEGEVGEVERNNPPTFLNDHFTGWDGTTTFATLGSNATVPTSAVMNLAGVSRYGNDTTPVWVFAADLGAASVENYANTYRTIGGGANPTTAIGGVPLPTGAPSVNYQTRPINEALNAPAWRFDRAIAGSSFRVPDSSFAMSTREPTNSQTYKSYSAFLRNRVGQNFFLETAVNVAEEDRRTQYLNGRALNDVIIDVNQTLPNGAANPYYLQPYGQAQRSRGSFGNEYVGARLAAAYVLDNTRFGNFTFNLMAGLNKNNNYTRIESMRVQRNADPRLWPYNDQVNYRYYWNSPYRDLPEITTATLGATTYQVRWMGDSQRPTDISYTDIETKYVQAAIKAALFSERLHLLGAVRRDALTVDRTINDFYGDYPVDWDGVTYQYRPKAPDDYLTLDETRPRNATTRQATVTTGSYQDDFGPPLVKLNSTTFSTGAVWHVKPWMSFLANYATSFNPSTNQLRLDGSLVPSPVSSGRDFGVRFYLLKNRMNVSITNYYGEETAQPFEINFTAAIQNIGKANKVGDLSTDGENQRGLPIVPTQAFDLRDRENNGYEIEVTANMTKNWRLSANYAIAEGKQTNAWRDTRAFIEQWKPTMRLVLEDAGVTFDANDAPVVNTAIPADQRPDAATARTAWITIFQNNLPNIVTDPQKIPGLTESTGNIFTDYRFSKGRLKGLGIGGGINYRGKKVIGFRGGDTIQDPASPTDPAKAIDNPDVGPLDVVYSDSYVTATAVLSYEFKLKNRRRVSTNFRVANVFNNDTPIYTGVAVQRPVDGDYLTTAARVATPTNFRYQTPRSYSFTMTLHF